MTDSMGQMEQRFVALCVLLQFHSNIRDKICHKSQPTRCTTLIAGVMCLHSAFNQRQLRISMVAKSEFFFQGDKGDTGLRGLDGNARIKVGRTYW